MVGRFVERVPFPYVMRLEHVYDALDVGGDIGTVEAIDLIYQPLQVNGQPHPHPNREIFRFAKGYGLVGWKAEWDSRGWLWFNERFAPAVAPGLIVDLH